MVFYFVQIHELEYLFFLSCKAQFFPPEFNIRLYDKNSESHYFFQHHWESEYFFRKKKHNVKVVKKVIAVNSGFI